MDKDVVLDRKVQRVLCEGVAFHWSPECKDGESDAISGASRFQTEETANAESLSV